MYLMLYNCLRCSVNDSAFPALDVAKTYLMTYGVPTIEAEHERVVDAAFVKKSEEEEEEKCFYFIKPQLNIIEPGF